MVPRLTYSQEVQMTVYIVLDRCEGFSWTNPKHYIIAVCLDKAKAEAMANAEPSRGLRIVEKEVIG